MRFKVHALNMDAVKEDAEDIRQNQSSGGGKDGADFYDWKDGDNNLRFMPPYNARGFIFKKKMTHFELPLGDDDRIHDCLNTWPSKFDSCPICDVLERLMVKHPDMDLRRQSAATNWYAQCIDRDEEEKGVQITRFTPKVRNWVTLQIDNPKIGDITDIERGFDVCVNKGTKKNKRGRKQVEYVPGFIPERCSMSDDDDDVGKWLDQIIDLDKYYAAPTDENIARIERAADRLYEVYRNKSDSKDEEEASRARARRRVAEEKYDERETKSEARRDEPARRERKKKSDEAPNTIDDIDPDSVPECHAGVSNPEPHDDGSIGFSTDLEKCLLCPEEMSCMGAKKKKGL